MNITTFSAVDLDRVLLRSKDFYLEVMLPLVEQHCEQQGIGPEATQEIVKALKEAEEQNRGMAFDYVAYFDDMMQQFGLEKLDAEELSDSFGSNRTVLMGEHTTPASFLADGAIDLIEAVHDEPDSEWGIVTSGGQKTQALKLALAGSVIAEKTGILPRTMVLSAEGKAGDISQEWYDQHSGLFRIPEDLASGRELYAKRVRVIDDKPKNLAIPEGAIAADQIIPVLAARPSGDSSEPGAIALSDIAASIRDAA